MHEGLEQIFYSYTPKLEEPLKIFLQSVFVLLWALLPCFLELRPVRYLYVKCYYIIKSRYEGFVLIYREEQLSMFLKQKQTLLKVAPLFW